MLFICTYVINCRYMSSLGRGLQKKPSQLVPKYEPTLLFIGHTFCSPFTHSLNLSPARRPWTHTSNPNQKSSQGCYLSPGLLSERRAGGQHSPVGCFLRSAACKNTSVGLTLLSEGSSDLTAERTESKPYQTVWHGTVSSIDSCHITSLLQPNYYYAVNFFFMCNFQRFYELQPIKEL